MHMGLAHVPLLSQSLRARLELGYFHYVDTSRQEPARAVLVCSVCAPGSGRMADDCY